jgi:GIY-YIG catalytic domain
MAIVYKATNVHNSHFYIGASAKVLKTRRSQHILAAHDPKQATCRIFHAALRKYGADAFKWVVLERTATIEEALEREAILIAELKPEYNISKGGRGVSGVPWTEERRAAWSAKMKGNKRTPETKARWQASYQEGGWGKPVMCLEDGFAFKSAADVARHYSINAGGVSGACSGKHVSVNGLHFAFITGPLSADERAKIIRSREQESHQRRQTAAFARPPLSEDAKARIGAASKGRKARLGMPTPESAKRRLSEIGKTDEALARFAKYRALGPAASARSVICLDDGKTYQSASAAARAYNIHNSLVVEVCNRDPRRVTAAGRIFRYIDDNPSAEADLAAAQERLANQHSTARAKFSKAVICVSDGRLFASTQVAGAACGIHPSFIAGVCRGERNSAHGLLFRYEEEE